MSAAAALTAPSATAAAEPPRSWRHLWNLSFGFFGVQVGFALQNANMSRIFQTLGTSLDDLPALWIAAPLTGLLIQPLVGHFSDRTWTRFGRRRPYFLGGAVLAALALVLMPNAGGLLVAASLLWLLDASLNTTMEPFRAFVGDMLPARQRAAGYAFQTGFIGAGAVAASLAPTILHDLAGLPNTAPPGQVPPSVRWSFYLGAGALLSAVLWTVLTTRERPPADDARVAPAAGPPVVPRHGLAWLAGGAVGLALLAAFNAAKELYLLGALAAGFGLLQLAAARQAARGRPGTLAHLVADMAAMPPTMRRLGGVQFCTWSALFVFWIYATPVIAQRYYGASDPASAAYNEGANWVGVLFAVYNGIAALCAFALPRLVDRLGPERVHMACLTLGAAGFASIALMHDPQALIGSMALIGIAWASVLTLPYTMLVGALPSAKFGVYMGLFNIFIVLPQLVVSSIMGAVVQAFFPADPAPAMLLGAALLLLAAVQSWALKLPRSTNHASEAAGPSSALS